MTTGKYITLDYIKQSVRAPLPLSFFVKLLKRHEPDLLHEAFDKINIAKCTSLFGNTGYWTFGSGPATQQPLDQFTKRNDAGQKNDQFVPIVDHLNVSCMAEDLNLFIEK